MEDNLQQLEATYGAPASLFERSAAARAKASGSTTEAVVAMWVGEEDTPGEDAPAEESPVTSHQSPVEDAPAPAAGALSGAALLAAVAEARGMPESLIERSAKARASATGGSIEDVLQEWATEEGLGSSVPTTGGESPTPPPQGEVAASRGADGEGLTPPSSGGLSGAALLAAVAEARGMPESLVERSASARAKTAGVDVDAVLRDWAEEEGLEVTAAETPAPIPPPQGEEAAAVPEGPAGDGGDLSLSGPALLSAVAAARKMPESLVERSAKARAKQTGGTSEEVLLEWAAEEGVDVSASGSPAEKSPVASPQSPVEDAPAAAPAGSLSGPALLSAVAAARKMPESLVERSAKARAKQTGGTSEDVLLEWADEEGLDTGGGAADFVPATDEPEDFEEISDAAAADAGPPAKAVIPSPPEPEPVEEPEPEEPASPRTRYPAWLAAVLVVIPLLAVLYLVVVPNQPTCGSAGQLAIDPATGVAVGCDGGEYGVDGVSNFSIGATVYEEACAVCHGADGGGGAGPAMAGGAVLEAFPAPLCSTQIEWIALGSSDWPDATYGANDTPVAGGMPGFEGQLTELEIAQVTLYERVEFGGLEIDAAETECGLGTELGSEEG
ncbi:MAG: c-type cytochrome [Acidimicrobiia bacterium]